MSIFSTLFSPIEKWRENPNRQENAPPSCNQEILSIDKTEKAKVEGIEEISINAKTNIIISTTQAEEIIMRIHGIATANYVLDAYVTQIEKSIRINAKGNTGSVAKVETEKREKDGKAEEGVVNHSFANITLEVQIPEKADIKRIKIKNSNGDIICKTSINMDLIDIISKNGNIQIGSTFKSLKISSKVGNVTVKSIAVSDLYVEIDNCDGSVNLNIDNIGNVYMQYQLDGACLINPKYSGEYGIYGKVNVSKGSFIYS